MLSRIGFSLLMGIIGGAIPALPLTLISSFVDDKPNFWFWPLFGTLFAVIVFFSPIAKDKQYE